MRTGMLRYWSLISDLCLPKTTFARRCSTSAQPRGRARRALPATFPTSILRRCPRRPPRERHRSCFAARRRASRAVGCATTSRRPPRHRGDRRPASAATARRHPPRRSRARCRSTPNPTPRRRALRDPARSRPARRRPRTTASSGCARPAEPESFTATITPASTSTAYVAGHQALCGVQRVVHVHASETPRRACRARLSASRPRRGDRSASAPETRRP